MVARSGAATGPIVVAYDKVIDGVVAMDSCETWMRRSSVSPSAAIQAYGAWREYDTIVGAVRPRGGVPLDMGRFYAQDCMTEATVVTANCAAVAVDA